MTSFLKNEKKRMMKNKATPLMFACRGGHMETVKTLLTIGAQLDAKTKSGKTPLMFACRRGNVRMVETLLAAGAAINDSTEFGETSLCHSIDSGKLSVVELLLNNGASLDCGKQIKTSPLTRACKNGNKAIVEFLLSKGAVKYIDGEPALTEAVKSRDGEIVKLLLNAGVDVDARSFCFAAGLGNRKMVKDFLKAGANPNMKAKHGETPLSMAVLSGKVNMVKLLLRAGAEPDQEMLLKASEKGYIKTAKMLINAGIDPNCSNEDDDTPLIVAVENDRYNMVKLLLSCGAHPSKSAIGIALDDENHRIVELIGERMEPESDFETRLDSETYYYEAVKCY